MDSSGNALSLKNEARLTLIKPTIDLAAETLTVTLLDEQTMPVRWSSSSSDPPVAALAPLVISLVAGTSRGEGEPVTVVQVCGDTCTCTPIRVPLSRSGSALRYAASAI